MRSTRTRRTLVLLSLLWLASAGTDRSLAGRAGDVRVESFRLLNEGVSAYNQGLYDDAVEKLRQSSSMALNSFRAHFYYGLALSATRQYTESVEILTVALDLNPDDFRTMVAIGDAHLKLGDVNEARAGYVLALKLRPAYPPALDGLARSYEAQAKEEKAIEYFRQAILSNKGYAPAYTHLGDLFLRLDRVREAVRLLEEAVTIRPDFAEGHNRLAVAYGSLGLHNEAVATVQKAIELDPTNPEHHYSLGWLQLNQSVASSAERSFRQALDLEPRMVRARMGLAEVARRRGDYTRALEELDVALLEPALDAKTTERLLHLRQAVARERRRLLELYSLAASGYASHEHYAELADLFARRSHWGQAARMQRLAPPGPEHEEWLAYLLFRDGRYRDAYRIYTRLAEEEDRSILRLNAGIALASLGNDPAAIEAYDHVLQKDPDHRLARLYLANAQLRMGSVDSAAKNYRTFLDSGGASQPAERVRRILQQIAPELLPDDEPALLPPAPPPPYEEAEDEAAS
jgi:tetratricopeptide (TPR) repeat protein